MVKRFWWLAFLVMAADPSMVINPNPSNPGTVTTRTVTAGFVDAGTATVAGALIAGSVSTSSVALTNGATITDPGPGGGATITAVDGGVLTLVYGSQTGTIQVDGSGNVILNNVANATTQIRGGGTPILSVNSSGVVVASGSLYVGGGSAIANLCVSTQGGCSMGAAATTCTVACTACTTSSSCFAQPYGAGATVDAVGVSAACSAGTVTLTAKTGPTVAAETFNVVCYN
jgi:hypothetical protein